MCLLLGLANEQDLPPTGSKGLYKKPGYMGIIFLIFLFICGDLRPSFYFCLEGGRVTPSDKDRIDHYEIFASLSEKWHFIVFNRHFFD